MLSQRVRTMEPSATLAVNALRLKLQAEGRRIINFSVGEPDFPTPEFVCDAAARAVRDGWTRYTPTAGVPELRQLVAQKTGEFRGVEVAPEEVVITVGAKQACANIILALVDRGDEVLMPAPYWVSYPEMIRLAEGIPVAVASRREDGYRVSPEQLEEHLTPRTVGWILNSPSNPTGSVYSATQIEALVEFSERHDLWILSDEIYDRFVYEGEFASPLSGPGRKRTLLANGLSKTYAMTGWRIGWAIADRETISALSRLQGHTTSNAAAVSQAAAIAALQATDDQFLNGMVAEFARRRSRALQLLGEIPGLEVHPPEGAFYIYLDFKELLAGATPPASLPRTSKELCSHLLEKAGIALVPGEAFGAPLSARLSYACSMEDLEAGITALRQVIEKV